MRNAADIMNYNHGEISKDFINKCECGGKLKYLETQKDIDKKSKKFQLLNYVHIVVSENREDANYVNTVKDF